MGGQEDQAAASVFQGEGLWPGLDRGGVLVGKSLTHF